MKKMGFTVTTIIIGFMLAVQFRSMSQPTSRDTRDMWQLQADLLQEQALQASLIKEIRSTEERLSQYETKFNASKEDILLATLAELKRETGLTKTTGPGIVLTIQPIVAELGVSFDTVKVPPESLQRLLNEINKYGAMGIAIQGERIINTSAIRDINGATKLDGTNLNNFPLKIVIMTETLDQAKKLFNRMQVSDSIEELFIKNLTISVSQPQNTVTLPPYDKEIQIKYMKPSSKKGGTD